MYKESEIFCKVVGGNEGDLCHYPTRLDTYGCGCFHDCKYCYAKSLLEFRGLWHPDNPRVASLRNIRRKISEIAKLPPRQIVRLGGMTDCLQPHEAKYRITYDTIKQLNEAGIAYLIVTKSDLIADDRYLAVMDRRLAHIQVSVTTTDDALSRTYEKASIPSRRIAAIERLQAEGFDVALRLSPFIPQYIDFDRLNAVKCDKILIEFLRVNSWVRKWFDIDYSDYSLKVGAYHHLPLEKKIEYLKLLDGWKEMSVCEDVPEHYKYWEEHFNCNPKDCCNLRRG